MKHIDIQRLIRLVEMSGRFTVSDEQMTAALDAWADDEKADVIAITEVSPERFAAVLVAWAEARGWFVWHPGPNGQDECAILSRIPFEETEAFRLTPLTLKRGRTAPIYLVAAKLVDGPWIGVWHSPAHNGGLKRTGSFAWPTRVYLSALLGLKAARRKMKGQKVALMGDWNLDLARKVMRTLLLGRFPAFRWGWRKGQEPTEGGRVIDGVMTNMLIVRRTKTLARKAGFDHRATLTILAA